ncbi:amidohydrolase family protein [Alteromonas sp. BMJM2]|uniref:amidohydrolase family protein n=1 Tax=Alteromonas sp. BMJM2 TaxID=2954241 RepID=UPI0022B315B0|nr:amidohydrolase family protein [Alteromonas sp. BMJM2]
MNWIDPHIHFFALERGQYDWLKPNNAPFWHDKSVIARSVYERDLFKGNHATLSGFVHIEAGFDNEQPWQEVAFLEQHCIKPFRSVANIDLQSSTSLSDIDRLKRFRSVVGLRHILDDDAANLLRSPKVLHSLKHMAANNLSFDAQFDITDVTSVSALLNVVERIPELAVIVNHVAAAPFLADVLPAEALPAEGSLFTEGSLPAEGSDCKRANSSRHAYSSLAYTKWQRNLRALAQCGNVAFKFSGMEMQNRQWTWPYVERLLNTALNILPKDNIMLASNFPLCTWRMPYAQLLKGYDDMLKRMQSQRTSTAFCLSKDDADKLRYKNAYKWYQF